MDTFSGVSDVCDVSEVFICILSCLEYYSTSW